MYAAYHLKPEEMTTDLIDTLKTVFHNRELVVIPVETYNEMAKVQRNAEYEERLERAMQDIDNGKGIVKTMDELEAMANG